MGCVSPKKRPLSNPVSLEQLKPEKQPVVEEVSEEEKMRAYRKKRLDELGLFRTKSFLERKHKTTI